jgi:hypothetical protein
MPVVSKRELPEVVVAILSDRPNLTVAEIVEEIEVAGAGDLLPPASGHKAVWRVLESLPNRISIERVEIIPQARRVKRYALVTVD